MATAGPMIHPVNHRPLLNIVSACLMARISRATLYRQMEMGLIEFVTRPTGRGRLVYADTLFCDPPEER